MTDFNPIMCDTADTKAWEVDTLRGHVNNVSCVMFHARSVCLLRNLCSANATQWHAVKLHHTNPIRRAGADWAF